MWRFLSYLFIGVLLLGCADENDCSKDVSILEKENEALMNRLETNLKEAKDFALNISEIHKNREQIIISKQRIRDVLNQGLGREGKSKEYILHEMKKINTLRMLSQKRIDELNTVKDSSLSMDVEDIVADINKFSDTEGGGIESLKDELQTLNYQLEKLNNSFDSITIENMVWNDVVQLYDYENKEGFYCIGDFKTLSEQGVIMRKGGVAGLGRVPVIVKDFNKKYFTKIDVSKITKLKSKSGEIEILSTHPQNSYKIEHTIEHTIIQITDPQSFWHSTKYLVVLEI